MGSNQIKSEKTQSHYNNIVSEKTQYYVNIIIRTLKDKVPTIIQNIDTYLNIKDREVYYPIIHNTISYYARPLVEGVIIEQSCSADILLGFLAKEDSSFTLKKFIVESEKFELKKNEFKYPLHDNILPLVSCVYTNNEITELKGNVYAIYAMLDEYPRNIFGKEPFILNNTYLFMNGMYCKI